MTLGPQIRARGICDELSANRVHSTPDSAHGLQPLGGPEIQGKLERRKSVPDPEDMKPVSDLISKRPVKGSRTVPDNPGPVPDYAVLFFTSIPEFLRELKIVHG